MKRKRFGRDGSFKGPIWKMEIGVVGNGKIKSKINGKGLLLKEREKLCLYFEMDKNKGNKGFMLLVWCQESGLVF